jgi:hypothetical protein
MCCGQKRGAMKADGSLNTNGASDPGSIKLHYRGQYSVQIRGAVTGRVYQFPKSNPVQMVDARDAASLMQTRMFRQVQ